ncbi:transmembrane amino acid transporter protein-domain-containing protein [Dichotomocladium elegans]|nr:transmembrane amino acid transporter protein-domain-containing protein [Dichotomocladium elegans]
MLKSENNKFQIEATHHEDENSIDCERSSLDIEHAPHGTAGTGKALFMFLKAFIGTGVIFIPASFRNGGLALSIALMVIIGSICLLAFQLLVSVHSKIGGSYGDMAGVLYGRWCRYVVLFFLVISQMGFAASYVMFVSENLQLVTDALSGCNAPFESKYWIWIAIAIIIPITWIRRISRLSWCAIIGDIFIAFGLICVLYYTGSQIHSAGAGPNIILVNQNDFGLMIGTAVFSFEGIGMVISIVEGMENPKKFPLVMNIGMVIVTCVLILIGTMGYVAYGDTVAASVVSNLRTDALSVTVQLLYSIAIILSAPFMLWPAIQIIERGIFGTKRSGQVSLKWKLLKNLVRALIGIVSAAVSFGVGAKNLDKFVSLIGIVACTPLCFLFPSMFYLKAGPSTIFWKIINAILILFGFAIIGYTLYVNIDSWLQPSTAAIHECRSL